MKDFIINARVKENLIFNGISYTNGSNFKARLNDKSLESLKPFLEEITIEEENIINETTITLKKPTTRKRKVVGNEE